MIPILVGLTGLLAPGFAHGLVSQPRRMAIWMTLFAIAAFSISISVWMIYVVLAVMVASVIDGVTRVVRLQPPIRWNGVFPAIAFVATVGTLLVTRAWVIEAFKLPSSSMAPTLVIDDHVFVDKLSIRWRSPQRGEVIVFRHPCEPRNEYLKRVIAIEGDTVEIRCDIVYINGKAVESKLIDGEGCKYMDYKPDEPAKGWSYRDCSRYRETLDGRSYEVLHDAERPNRDRVRASGQLTSRRQQDFPSDGPLRHCANSANQRPGMTVVTESDVTNECKPHLHFVVPPDSLFALGDNRPNSNDSRYWGSIPVDDTVGRVIGIWKPIARTGSVE